MEHIAQNTQPLSNIINCLINAHFTQHDQLPTNLYELTLEVVEQPLFEVVMHKCKYNQVRAAKMLGLSRGTLRKKLKMYFDDKYCGTRY